MDSTIIILKDEGIYPLLDKKGTLGSKIVEEPAPGSLKKFTLGCLNVRSIREKKEEISLRTFVLRTFGFKVVYEGGKFNLLGTTLNEIIIFFRESLSQNRVFHFVSETKKRILTWEERESIKRLITSEENNLKKNK